MDRRFEKLEVILDYTFKDRMYLVEALTHSSYANEVKKANMRSNERFEFLGDSVLSIVVSDHLFVKYKDIPEGELTKLRSRIVCEGTLAEVSKELGIGEFMSFGRGELMTGGRVRVSILADAFEAVIAAIYLDGGLEEARRFVLTKLNEKIESAGRGEIFVDYKTRLQEIIQSTSRLKIKYEILEATGPDHNKIFKSAVKLDEDIIGVGVGKSKKDAEQMAASNALNEAQKFEKKTL